MCGIFAYIGPENAYDKIVNGLKRLEYRGYDSWGVATLSDGIHVSKQVGSIGDAIPTDSHPSSAMGIGHTRWATHGSITRENAHPHFSTDGSFVLAQNGIVENYQSLKAALSKKGYKFETETDTEVIVRLVEDKLTNTKDLDEATRRAFLELEGRNTIILLTKDEHIVAARNGSPLVIGVNDDMKEIFFSSDTLSFAPFVKKVIVIDNGQIVSSYKGSVTVKDASSGKTIDAQPESINLVNDKVDKEGYDHFMLKEIHESPFVVRQLINQDLNEYQEFAKALKKARNVYTIASGTAGIAASQIAFYLRENAGIKALGLIGADALEYEDLFTEDDILIAPSQSGETADVLEVLERVKKKGVKIASFVNMQGSTMTRLSDYKFLSQAGPEICVMSTKVFVSQIAWGYLISKIAAGKTEEGVRNLRELSKQMEDYLKDEQTEKTLKQLSHQIIAADDIFLLGKYQNFNIVKEGMVKLIEGTYKHAHAIPAGDLKHYAITLMEKGVPVIFAVSEDKSKADIINAVNQVKARGATVIAVASKPNESYDHFIEVPNTGETSAILNVIPLQLLAYYMTVELRNNVDKPRNIAKSVTVK